MKELQEIIRAYESIKKSESTGVLATIVKVKGSTYRRPGARMLILNGGSTIGAISSGCLEVDVAERARKILASGQPETVVYDMTATEEDVWGLNLGCNGVIHILLEPLPLSSRSLSLKFISDMLGLRKAGVLATVFRVDGEYRATVGSHLCLQEDGIVVEEVHNPVLAAALTEDCLATLRAKKSALREYRFTEGVVEAFLEFIRPPVSLLVVGAGADALPLVGMAKELGWTVNVADHRPAFVTRERFPKADALHVVRPEEILETVQVRNDSNVVLMTHNFSHDVRLLRAFLPSPAAYIGLLGPSNRTELLLAKVRETGFTPTLKQLERLHNPIGLDLGAESPEEIALSILSEIQALLSSRTGGPLRNHGGPIHEAP